jgi:hypothetical protein
MSEVQTRPSQSSAQRGRGSARGGRGGSFRGGRSTRNTTTNGETQNDGIDEQSELGQLKKKYSTQLAQLKEISPDMATEDILLELKENNGDLQATADKITEGQPAHPFRFA